MLALGLLVAGADDAQASHLRGGKLGWNVVGADANGYVVEFKGEWYVRWQFHGSPPVGGTFPIGSLSTGDGGSYPVTALVTSVTSSESWMAATLVDPNTLQPIRHHYATGPGGVTFTASIQSGDRLGATGSSASHINNPNRGQTLQTQVALPAPGSPTPNSSPVVHSGAVFTCAINAVCNIPIHATDPDGNALSFAFSTPAQAGSSSFTQPPGMMLSGSTVVWNTNGLYTQPGYACNLYSAQVKALDASAWMSWDFMAQLCPGRPASPTGPAIQADFDWRCRGGRLVDFRDLSTPSGGQSLTAIAWQWGDGTGQRALAYQQTHSHAYGGPGPYRVNMTVWDSNGAVAYRSHDVLADCLDADFDWTPATPCVGETVVFRDLTTGPAGSHARSDWDFGDGSPLQSFTPPNPFVSHAYAATGTFVVTLRAFNVTGAWDEQRHNLTVVTCPRADFQWTPQSPCEGDPVTFTDRSTPAAGQSIVHHVWEFGDGTSAGAPPPPNAANPVVTHTYAAPGIRQVNLTVWDGSGHQGRVQHNVTVRSCPVADFDYLPAPPCVGEQVQFVDRSRVAAGRTVDKHHWEFGDGTSLGTPTAPPPPAPAPSPTHTYAVPGSFQVNLTVWDSSGGTGSTNRTVHVIECPVADFDHVPARVCVNEPVTFQDRSRVASGHYLIHHYWEFGDGSATSPAAPPPLNPPPPPSSGTNPTHTYASVGTVLVNLTVWDNTGHFDHHQRPVQVGSCPPYVDFTWSPAPGCQAEPMAFTPTLATSGTSTLRNGTWVWDDGTTTPWSAPPAPGTTSKTYAAPGRYLVTLWAFDSVGRSGHATKAVIVADCSPVVSFTWNPGTGCMGSPVDFTDSSSPRGSASLQQASWDWDDGTPNLVVNPWSPGPHGHTFAAAGLYDVELTVMDSRGRSAAAIQTVNVVNCTPTAAFAWYQRVCAGQPVTFYDLSQAQAPATLASSHWDFGDGTSQTLNPWASSTTHTYLAPSLLPTDYTVTLTVTDSAGRTASTSQRVQVQAACLPPPPPPPQAGFIAVDAGAMHACGLGSDGNIVCWGDNGHGQANPYLNGDAVALSTGGYGSGQSGVDGRGTTCALLLNGNVDCWGSLPLFYAGGDANGVSAGGLQVCILLWTGNVDCHDNCPACPSSPWATDYLGGDAVAVSAGSLHNCILRNNGDVHCWGDNATGQAAGYYGGDAVAVSAGGAGDTPLSGYGGAIGHTCVLLTGGNTQCWGDDFYGQSAAYSAGDAIAVAAGGYHTCVLQATGNVFCWGNNDYGQAAGYLLGDAVAVAAGSQATCILRGNGTHHCWGLVASPWPPE